MIKPLIKSYEEQARLNHPKPPVSASDIVKFYKQKAKELYEASLKEAENKEDEDVIVLPQVVEEPIHVCKIEKEFREYLENAPLGRDIKEAYVHCVASQPEATVSSILGYWKRLGWKNFGYHVLISTDFYTVLADFGVICNGVKGRNAVSIHISYVGGIDRNGKPKDTRTDFQKRMIEIFLEVMTKRIPGLKVIGHGEVSPKACPSFKVKNEYPKYWTGK
jgi:N-acetylmuramoyl-L-alanine amidase